MTSDYLVAAFFEWPLPNYFQTAALLKFCLLFILYNLYNLNISHNVFFSFYTLHKSKHHKCLDILTVFILLPSTVIYSRSLSSSWQTLTILGKQIHSYSLIYSKITSIICSHITTKECYEINFSMMMYSNSTHPCL